MILATVTPVEDLAHTFYVRRYDTDLNFGLTHEGVISGSEERPISMWDIRKFRNRPPDACIVGWSTPCDGEGPRAA